MEILFVVLQGVFTVSLTFLLLTTGQSYLSAPESILLMMVETVVAPLVVYMAGLEIPSEMTLIAMVVICIALGTYG